MKCESRHKETDKVACRTIFPEGGLRGLAAISLENKVVKSRANSRAPKCWSSVVRQELRKLIFFIVLFELKIGSVTSRCSKNEPTHPFPTPISKSLFSERSKTGPGSEGIEPKLRRDRKGGCNYSNTAQRWVKYQGIIMTTFLKLDLFVWWFEINLFLIPWYTKEASPEQLLRPQWV